MILRKIISFFIPKNLKHSYRLKKYPGYKQKYEKAIDLERLKSMPRFAIGQTNLLGNTLTFVDNASFFFIQEELFNKQIYKFISKNSTPYIIDAGANIGLSVIYFKNLYPNAEIIAFEPDDKVFQALESNVKSFKLENVMLIKKALWNQETILEFMSEGADAGRVAIESDKQSIIKVPTERLRKYLNRKVDFLKIDIEGAETTVLEDCADLLHNVENLFVEYHSFVDKPQNLHQLLAILTQAGFRYNVQQIGIFSVHPFVEINSSLSMDNQLNIFATRQ